MDYLQAARENLHQSQGDVRDLEHKQRLMELAAAYAAIAQAFAADRQAVATERQAIATEQQTAVLERIATVLENNRADAVLEVYRQELTTHLHPPTQ